MLDVCNMPRVPNGAGDAWHSYTMAWRDVQVEMACQGHIIKKLVLSVLCLTHGDPVGCLRGPGARWVCTRARLPSAEYKTLDCRKHCKVCRSCAHKAHGDPAFVRMEVLAFRHCILADFLATFLTAFSPCMMGFMYPMPPA